MCKEFQKHALTTLVHFNGVKAAYQPHVKVEFKIKNHLLDCNGDQVVPDRGHE